MMGGPRILAEARNYQQMLAVLRTRADELGLSREVADAESGLPSGYSGKLFGPSTVRKLGVVSLGAMLGVLRLKLIIVEDDTYQRAPIPQANRNRQHAARKRWNQS